MGELRYRTGDRGKRQTLRKGEGSEMWEFSPLWLCHPEGSEGNLNALRWLQLMAGFLVSQLALPACGPQLRAGGGRPRAGGSGQMA